MIRFLYRLHARAVIVALLVVGVLLPTGAHAQGNTGNTGSDSPTHKNRQPYLGIAHIVRLQGTSDELGEIGLFAGGFAPRDWAYADGQFLPIAFYPDLFDKLGTTYGGDGETTFRLPDLRGRAAIGMGAGMDLTPRNLGDAVGETNVLLTIDEMPSHNHAAEAPVIIDYAGGGQPHNNMQPSLAVNYMIAATGTFPSRSSFGDGGAIPSFGLGGNVPFIGEIVQHSADAPPPTGWLLANGQEIPIAQNQALFAILGTKFGGDNQTTFRLPDFSGRSPIQPGIGLPLTTRFLGQKLGVEEVTLGVSQLPGHVHTGVPTSSGATESTGGGLPHENMQPSLGINHIIALSGVYPSRNSLDQPAASDAENPGTWLGSGADPIMGSISMFAGNYAPLGWAFANGQILPISSNVALFSVLGTKYGGDGESTFALPDLRGRTPIHYGTGPGLDTIAWGEKGGNESVTVYGLPSGLPSHAHAFGEQLPGDANGDGHIDGVDYLVWAANFGDDPADDPPGPPENGDFNGDGVVDGLDYLAWAANFGQGPFDTPATAVPEPGACTLLIMGTTMLLSRRRRHTSTTLWPILSLQ